MKRCMLCCILALGLYAETAPEEAPQETNASIKQESSTQESAKQEALSEAPKQEASKQDSQESQAPKEKPQDRSGFVVGIFGGASMMDHSWDYYKGIFEIEGHEQSKMGIAPSYGIKLGYDAYFLPKHALRAYIDYMGSNFLDSSVPSGKINLHTFAINAEYKYEVTDKFGVFVGANVNYTLLDSQKAGSQGGVGFGVNAGLTYLLAQWAELELGVRYLGDALQERAIPVDSYGSAIGASRELIDFGDLIAVRFGVNFKF